MQEQLTDEQIENLKAYIGGMSLKEKIGQTALIHASGFYKKSESEAAELLSQQPVGGLFVGGEFIFGAEGVHEEYIKMAERFNKNSKIPLFVAGDMENGAGASVASLTKFPPRMTCGAADSEKLAYEEGKHTALEARLSGLNWNFGPVVDILLNWQNSLTNTRAFGDDPKRVAKLSAAYIKGMKDHGVISCGKHFPGDGVDMLNQHIVTSVNSLSKKEWFNTYGYVYREVIEAGIDAFMIGHIAIPWLDEYDAEKNRYRPATLSHNVLTYLLKEHFNFEGVAISDALNMGGITCWDTHAKRTIESFNSGMDIMLWPDVLWPEIRYCDLMEKSVLSGEVSEQRLNDAVYRVLRLKMKMGLMDITDGKIVRLKIPELTESAADIRANAKQAAVKTNEKGITLARNKKNLIPLSSGVKKILVIKPVIGEIERYRDMDAFVDILKDRGLSVTVMENFDGYASRGCIRKLETQGERWDAVLVLLSVSGYNQLTMEIGGEAPNGIWALQNADTVEPIFISFSSPFLLHSIPFANTLINCYGTNADTYSLLAKALFGEFEMNTHSPVKLGGWGE